MTYKPHVFCPVCSGVGFVWKEAFTQKSVRKLGFRPRKLRTSCGICAASGYVQRLTWSQPTLDEGTTPQNFLFPTRERILGHSEDVERLAKVAKIGSPKNKERISERIVVAHNALYIYQCAYGDSPITLIDASEKILSPEDYIRTLCALLTLNPIVIAQGTKAEHNRPPALTIKSAKILLGIMKPRKEEDED